MGSYFRTQRTLHFPITLSVILMVLNVVLMVWWIYLLAHQYLWSALTIGTVLFVLIVVGLVLYMILAIKEIRLNQRQANFIDSVTHELKSPIASLKLYLETLQLRVIDDRQRADFYDFMMDDLERLDRLINHMLEIGRLDAIVTQAVPEDIEMRPLLEQCAQAACANHRQPVAVVTFRVQPAIVRGGRLALEMIFRNLLDNAIKYSTPNPAVEVEVAVKANNRVVTRIIDNGVGVEPTIRKKIFGLFFRGGNELERTRQGTGLGLYIVQTLVRRMTGKIAVHGRDAGPGSVFEVDLPGRPCES